MNPKRVASLVPVTEVWHSLSARTVPLAKFSQWRLGALAPLLALIAFGVVLPAAVGAASGSLNIPRNDDWSYRGIAMRLFLTGRIELDGAAQAAVLGQVLLVQPFLHLTNGGPIAFAMFAVIAGAIFMVAGLTFFRMVVDRRAAILAITLVIISPPYLSYASSFMTDVPALAAQYGCLALGAAAIQVGRSSRWAGPLLAASLIAGIVGFSIREFALAAPVAVILAAICARPRSWPRWLALALTIAVCGFLYWSRNLLSGSLGIVPAAEDAAARFLPESIGSIAFVLLPATTLAAWRWRKSLHPHDIIIGWSIGVAVTFILVARLIPGNRPTSVFLDNLTTQWGSPASEFVIGGRPLLFPDSVWMAITVVACIAVVTLLAVSAGVVGAHIRLGWRSPHEFLRQMGSPRGILVLYAVFATAGIAAFGLVYPIYDRYLWPATPAIAALLLYVPRRLRSSRLASSGFKWTPRLLILAQVPALTAISVVMLLNSNAFDSARWRAGQELVARGNDPRTIDAGFEWLGTYPAGSATPTNPVVGATNWWQGWWRDFRMCAAVASIDTVHGLRLVKTLPVGYQLFLFTGPQIPFYLFERDDPSCARVPAP